MATPAQSIPKTGDTPLQSLFAATLGGLLGLTLLKWGNPVVLSEDVTAPSGGYEWLLTAWPPGLRLVPLALMAVIGLALIRHRPKLPAWLLLAPLPWFVWQLVAAAGTVDPALTTRTVTHFATNTVCFYLGLLCLSPIRDLRWFWAGLIAGFALVLLSGWDQHFGGLESSRELFFNEIYPQLNGEAPEELMKRMSSDRIFGTLFYPNTLAGVLLLLTPVTLGAAPDLFRNGSVRRIVGTLLVCLSAGCLYWSGSKAGWLLALGLLFLGLLRLPLGRRWKTAIGLAVLVAGAAGFLWTYSGYLQKGAPSAVARADYWDAALRVAAAHPVNGTGPGTFARTYPTVKRPESEMARLTHNDYLQQACDSGVPGLVFYAGFISAILFDKARRVWTEPVSAAFWVWLGLLGISMQSLVEFGLYIPAVSWPFMVLMGWRAGSTRNGLDKPDPALLTSRKK